MYGGGEDGEYSGLSLVEISKIFVMQAEVFIGTEPLDRGAGGWREDFLDKSTKSSTSKNP